MSIKTQNQVTIYVTCNQDNDLDADSDSDSDCDQVPKEELKAVAGFKELAQVEVAPETKVEEIKKPIKFLVKKGLVITDLTSLIKSLENPRSEVRQKELVKHLKDLNNMIGMKTLKEQIINQILFFIQGLNDSETFLHTVLTGPPGTGKTRAISILAKIYCSLGILDSDKIIRADRSSLVGRWLGSTSIKTREVLESAHGGVLILDEVYSLGNKEQSDSFSKECIDTINQYLSEHVNDFVCVIAGYKDLVNECFFNYNPGLERRFPWRFTIEPYDPIELSNIMKIQLGTGMWSFSEDITDEFLISSIKKNKECFSGNGGDTKNLLDKCKVANARRVFTNSKIVKSKANKRFLNKEDVCNGLKCFVESKNVHKKEKCSSYSMMYI